MHSVHVPLDCLSLVHNGRAHDGTPCVRIDPATPKHLLYSTTINQRHAIDTHCPRTTLARINEGRDWAPNRFYRQRITLNLIWQGAKQADLFPVL